MLVRYGLFPLGKGVVIPVSDPGRWTFLQSPSSGVPPWRLAPGLDFSNLSTDETTRRLFILSDRIPQSGQISDFGLISVDSTPREGWGGKGVPERRAQGLLA